MVGLPLAILMIVIRLRYAQDDSIFPLLPSVCLVKGITTIGVWRDVAVGAAISRPPGFVNESAYIYRKRSET